jgi:hypothetical protein
MELTFKEPKNVNYVAVVTTIRAINVLDNCDNVVGVPLFGYQAIVNKDTKVGDLVVVFTAETQLSDAYAKANNLYREPSLNANPEVKGYIEQNRRVRAIKFRGHRSDALVMPLASLSFTGIDVANLKDGDQFDELAGVEICQKYEVPRNMGGNGGKKASFKVEKFKRIDNKFLPEHLATAHWLRQMHHISDDAQIVVTQKLHGTSIRIGNVPVNRQLNWKDKVAEFFGVAVQKTGYDNVYGSRRVIKDANNPNQVHYYKDDIWTAEGKKYDAIVPQNFILYGELIGWTGDGGEIMTNYTYNVPKGRADLYVYRIMVITNDGRHVELSWDAVKRFCVDNGINHVPEFFRGRKGDLGLAIEALTDRRYYDDVKNGVSAFTDMPIPLSDAKLVDEGICVRILESEAVEPTILKAKSPLFLAHETKLLDANVVDLESAGEEDAG